ncbi:hypothetical protein FHG87_004263 [Trinorchestia longiramus]|nr:hypothetical protein FHG87_004263 [Trinorchestia longiramus]
MLSCVRLLKFLCLSSDKEISSVLSSDVIKTVRSELPTLSSYSGQARKKWMREEPGSIPVAAWVCFYLIIGRQETRPACCDAGTWSKTRSSRSLKLLCEPLLQVVAQRTEIVTCKIITTLESCYSMLCLPSANLTTFFSH